MLSYRKLAMRVLGRPLHTGGSDSPRPASQRAAAFILTAAMLTTLTAPAFAGTWDIENGDITISAGESGNDVTQNNVTTKNDTNTTITNSNKDKPSSNTVTIKAENENDKVEVKFEDVNIDASSRGEAAVSVTGKGDTNIELNGDNELKSGADHAGLEHNKTRTSGELTIQDKDKNGSLTATGGDLGAGIGGSMGNAGQVTITGGNITATGGEYGAGIGGGIFGSGDVTISGNAKIENAQGGNNGSGIGGGSYGKGDVTISGNAKIENATGGNNSAGIGGGYDGKGNVTISGNAKIENATGGEYGAGIGGGIFGLSNVTIEGNTKVNATGGAGGAAIGGGAGAKNNSDNNGNQITIKSNENGSPTINAVGGSSDEEKGIVIGGAGIGSGVGDAKADITLEGKVTIVAKGGEGNAAIGANGDEQEFTGLDGSITRYNSEGNNITRPTDPVPAVPSSSGGGSADASVQESVFPGLVVTDKDGQHISYTSIRGNNVLSLRVGRFTASLRASLAALRQLRAEGIDTITFQTILCSTTLSVDELLAMGGEDAEAVLTHRLTASSLTVG